MVEENGWRIEIMINQKNSDIFFCNEFYLGDFLSKGRPKGDLFVNTAYTKEVLHGEYVTANVFNWRLFIIASEYA